MSQSTKRYLGIPYNWNWPGWDAIFWNMWNTDKNSELFPPKVFGAGWSINFGYALSKKTLWKRVIGFLVGLIVLLIIIYALIVFATIVYYLLTPQSVPTIVLS